MADLSVVIARILALTYIAAGVAALSGTITFAKMCQEFEQSSALTFVTGFFTLVCGVLLVSYHNFWIKDWRVLITLIGWMSLFKGITLIAAPQSISFFKGWYKNARIWGIVMLVLGLLFGYLGFIR